MEWNPMKKVITGIAAVTAIVGADAQANITTNNRQEINKISTLENDSILQIYKNAVDAFEKNLAKNKELKSLNQSTIAVYSVDQIIKPKTFISVPEYNPNFWTSRLEIALFNNDTTHSYLDRSFEGLSALEKEKQLQDKGIINPTKEKLLAYVSPDTKIVVDVDQNKETILVVLFNKNGSNKSISVKIEKDDINSTLNNLTKKTLELIQY